MVLGWIKLSVCSSFNYIGESSKACGATAA